MATFWYQAPEEVLDLTKQVIDKYHKRLTTARVGVIMRNEAPSSNGRLTLARCKKISKELQLHMPFDFVVWIADDEWKRLSARQREALLDHELSHAGWDGINAHIRGHDVEEFNHILKRWGAWWPDSDGFAIAIQQSLFLDPAPDLQRRTGSVGTLNMSKVAEGALEAE